VSKYEERAYNVGRTRPNIAAMKNQLSRLRHDLEQFVARKPDGAVVSTLRERIREMEATIAEAEANKKRESQARMPADEGAAPGEDDGKAAGRRSPERSSTAGYAIGPRFPPRGHPGR